ncbi:DUF3017 domain-containing protein [Streptomyces sp. col6]|uniref:DUF3017 domain-containing protein n=1 Tax=Streptomyces sp. col6 TaxID=2478958 RepID=UPI0011CDDA48|nr:DUF3017 domain-containing protein [Streptomyces sp. col6]TXS05814.1 DUF3017 domain-containing protein [Streptomyces sp. col6]
MGATSGAAEEAGTGAPGAPAETPGAPARTPGSAAGDASGAEAGGADANGADVTVADEGGATRSDASASGADEDGGPDPAPDTGATVADTRRSRRFSLTRDTARPEGGGRAAGGDAPAPARQWPLLAVLCTAGAGLLIVAADPFEQAFRVGTILIGIALVAGAVLRIAVRSVGMLAVRSRFTDLVTYGLLGTLIVLLALVAQPQPWLDIPFLEDAVHFTVR